MSTKKKDFRAELGRLQIHTKTGRVKFLTEVADAWHRLYPRKAAWFRQELAKLRQVTTDGYAAGRNGHMYCKVRVPTDLWLFLQRWDPEFGKDSADMELLIKVWDDLVRVRRKDPRVRTRLWIDKEYRRANAAAPAEGPAAPQTADLSHADS